LPRAARDVVARLEARQPLVDLVEVGLVVAGVAGAVAELGPAARECVRDLLGDLPDLVVLGVAADVEDLVVDDVARGARQLLEVFRAVDMSTDLFESRGHTRIKQMQYLLETRQIDSHYYWTDPPGRAFGDDDVLTGTAPASA